MGCVDAVTDAFIVLGDAGRTEAEPRGTRVGQVEKRDCGGLVTRDALARSADGALAPVDIEAAGNTVLDPFDRAKATCARLKAEPGVGLLVNARGAGTRIGRDITIAARGRGGMAAASCDEPDRSLAFRGDKASIEYASGRFDNAVGAAENNDGSLTGSVGNAGSSPSPSGGALVDFTAVFPLPTRTHRY